MAKGRKSKTVVLDAAQIQAMWQADRPGAPVVPSEIIAAQHHKVTELEAEKLSLEKQLQKAVMKLDKSRGSSADLRLHLDKVLSQYGVTAAFEPLIKMATDVWPEGHPLHGEFKLDADQRIKIWCEILAYQLPKLKAMEVSGQIDNSITVMVRRFGNGDSIVERTSTQNLKSATNKETPVVDVPTVVTRSFTAPKDDED